MPSKARRLLEDLDKVLPDGIPGFREERIVQDQIGQYLISTIKVKDHEYETIVMDKDSGQSRFSTPVYSDTERGAWKNHNRLLKEVRRDKRPCKPEFKKEVRIYPPYTYDNE